MILLAAGIVATLLLAWLPLRSDVVTTARDDGYTVQVPADNFGVQAIASGFQGLCDSAAPPYVGNQTFWLSWQVLGDTPPSYVRLQDIPVTTLYNASGVLSGGYAQSSAEGVREFCGDNLFFGAYANTSLMLILQVGVTYSYASHTAFL